MRMNDGSTNYVDYEPNSTLGSWQPTAPAYMTAENPQWATLKPFAMTSDGQFRAPAPPAIGSAAWNAAAAETLSLGSVNSTTRTADETQAAKFWNDGSGSTTPPGHWNAIADTVLQQQNGSLAEDARVLAELNIGEADASISAWDTKYDYNTWRPITVAADADMLNDPSVVSIPGWTPLLTTPPHPEYVSGHSTFSGAASTILSALLGNNVSFSSTVTVAGNPVTRSFTSFTQAAIEAGESRIWGGIHFQFSDDAGLVSGDALGAYILQTFSTSLDKTPPTITIASPTGGSVATSQNISITGRVLDNLSGVQTFEAQVDGGAFAPVSFDGFGNFSFTTSFATNGTAEGKHTVNFEAVDVAGNVTPVVPVVVTVDTLVPQVTIASPLAGALSPSGVSLTGKADGTGTSIVALSYQFDGGIINPMSYSPDGSFQTALSFSGLAAGSHTLTVSATDAARNVGGTTIRFSLAAPAPLTLDSVLPVAQGIDIGLTYRPKIVFSAPVNPSTLTSSDLFLSDSSGKLIPATIVPSDDGTYAYLFPVNPMPGASQITLTVDGSKIKSADGKMLLDAAGSGTPGSKYAETFTTVNEAYVQGTTLSGILADPGPDLKPNTTDDVRSGPDGILMTADDVYLLPIAGATLYILGHEDQKVITGANGSFSFPNVPTGDVKLVIDGRTATNPPSGNYFPEMTLDLTIKPGVANTVMGSMGTRDEQAADGTAKGVYLPRVQSTILQTVSNTVPTKIVVPPSAAANLTPQQQKQLSITIAPNSLVGSDGQKMSTGQVGISTVPPQIVMDMLPPGVMQHTFDITIQAPGVTTFSTPASLTFPNVFNAAPGRNCSSSASTTPRVAW